MQFGRVVVESLELDPLVGQRSLVPAAHDYIQNRWVLGNSNVLRLDAGVPHFDRRNAQSAMRFLVVHVRQPLADDPLQGGERHNRVLCWIVVALLEDVVEGSTWRAMRHAFIQGPKKAFDLSLE